MLTTLTVPNEQIRRLQELTAIPHEHCEGMNECSICDTPILTAAIETIGNLKAEVGQLREALEQIVDIMKNIGDPTWNDLGKIENTAKQALDSTKP